MTFRRRARRPDDGLFLPKDAKLWRRLIKHVRYAARAPLADTSHLYRAAERAVKAAVPAGYLHRHSCFLRLTAQARGLGRLMDAERAAHAIELAQLADQCEAAILAAESAPAAQQRADIFG